MATVNYWARSISDEYGSFYLGQLAQGQIRVAPYNTTFTTPPLHLTQKKKAPDNNKLLSLIAYYYKAR